MPNLKNPGFIDFDSIELTQKTKETLKDQSLTHITLFGEEAINLIKGKFKSHANSVLRNQYKEEV